MRWVFLVLFMSCVAAKAASEFAQLGTGNIVQTVNEVTPAIVATLGGTWNDANAGPIRANIGFTWTGTVFEPPRPYPSWAWSPSANAWFPPVPLPAVSPNGHFEWNEASQQWAFVNNTGAVTTTSN